MPNQSGSYANPRLDLGEAFAEFDLSQSGFIGLDVLPLAEVPRKDASFSKIDREGMLRRSDVKRAARGVYNRDGYETSDDSYACEEYGQEFPLDDSDRAFYASDFDAEYWASEIAMRRVMQEHEIRVASAIFNTTTWTGAALTTAVGTEWSTSTADAKADILAAKEKVRRQTGMEPNALIISKKVFDNLLKNDDLNEAVKYVQLGTVEAVAAAMAKFFGLETILVGGGVYNGAAEGAAASITDIWDAEYAMVCRLQPAGSSIQNPGLGRTFLWTGDSPNIVTIEEYREEQTRSWVYRARHHVDEKVFDAAYGHLLSNITA